MMRRLGIRREDKSRWERRVPLTPDQVRKLMDETGVEVTVQPSEIRAFPDEAYRTVGATIDEDLSGCDLVIAVKEIPSSLFREGGSYLFFSHTIKGQDYNMPMLQRLLDLNTQLLDYERIVDEKGRRKVFFGRFAGLAGMLDTLWTLGQRLVAEGVDSPLCALKPAHAYADLEEAKADVARAGAALKDSPLPASLCPLAVGFLGYGNVSLGAQEVFDLLPHIEVSPNELPAFMTEQGPQDKLVKVVYREEDLAERKDGATFVLNDYFQNPDDFQSRFAIHASLLTVIVTGIYWEPRYPRFLPEALLADLFAEGAKPRLRVLGDITCDIKGSFECTVKATNQDAPVFTFLPGTPEVDAIEARGVNVLAVDNLPCELPADASRKFGEMLLPLMPGLLAADFSNPLDDAGLSPEMKRALIVHQGELTPDYTYLKEVLKA